MPLYIYRCPQGHSTEALRGVSVAVIACDCGKVSQRQSVYATAIGGRQRPPVAERRVSLREYREASEQSD